MRDKHAIPEGEAFSDYVEAKPERRGRGRKLGFQMSHEHRIKIQNSKILSHLQSFFETGKPALSDGQIRVGLGLLKKVLPDLQTVTIAGDPANPVFHQHEHDLTVHSDAELAELARILGKGNALVRNTA